MPTPAEKTDRRFMRMALACAARGAGETRPNPPVGAVVVARDGKTVLGRGWHHRAGGPHAEVEAIAACGDADLSGATIYVTLEPCSTTGRTPPCTDLLLRRKIGRVVFGCPDPNPKHAGRGADILRAGGAEVLEGVLEAECRRMIEPFASTMLRHRPHLTLKLALTLDGRIADRAGSSRWITGPESLAAVQRMRRVADAILVGSGTALADDPQLRCRIPGAPARAWRVVADARGRTPPSSRLLSDAYAAQTVVATTPAGAARLRAALPASCPALVWELPADAEGHVDLSALLARLTAELGVMEVLCEGGGLLAGALLRAGLVDRLAVFHAPIVLGDDSARPGFAGLETPLAAAYRFRPESHRAFGRDLLSTYVQDPNPTP